MTGLFVSELNETIFSTALPTLAGELGAAAHLQWVTTAYVAASTVVMLLYGRLSDRLGRKPLFLAALSIFLLGSVIGALAPTMAALVTGRAVQGLGGGGLLILVQAMLADLVPARQRARALAAVSAVFAVAAVLGPVLGGGLVERLDWRAVFWVSVPLALVALVAAAAALPPQTARPTAPSPPLLLLRNRNVAIPTVASMIMAVAMFGTITYLPTYLQLARRLTPTQSGLMMLALIGGLGLATVGSAQLVSRTGHHRVLPITGAGLAALGLLLLGSLELDASLVLVGFALFVLGAGLGCALQILLVIVQVSVPAADVGTATAGYDLSREIGVTIGAAAIGAVLTARLAGRVAQDGLTAAGLDPANLTPERLRSLPDGLQAAVALAYHDALTPIFGALAPLMIMSGAALAFLRPTTLGAPDAVDPSTAAAVSSR